jgi:hypothetical protein
MAFLDLQQWCPKKIPQRSEDAKAAAPRGYSDFRSLWYDPRAQFYIEWQAIET